jgi:hypothetical protein
MFIGFFFFNSLTSNSILTNPHVPKAALAVAIPNSNK